MIFLYGVQLPQALNKKKNELFLILLSVVIDDVPHYIDVQVHAIVALLREQPFYQIAEQLVSDLVVIVVVDFYIFSVRGFQLSRLQQQLKRIL